MAKNIEVEARSFVTTEQYKRLREYFNEHAKLLKEDNQETFYFSGDQDLRIQRNDFYAKIWMKKGKIHDAHREELEIQMERDRFEKLEQLFLTLGYTVEIKWFRKRLEFLWDDVTVCLDSTKGYGDIIELEKMSGEAEKEAVYADLVKKLESLDIAITPKEEFDQKYQFYKTHWRELVG